MPFKSEKCFKKNGEPLSTYFSEYEAIDGAEHVKAEYGIDLLPYRCSKCKLWHLSPKDRQTPSKVCVYCKDSNGHSKELYETQSSAQKRAEIIKKEQRISLKIYKCPHQDGWHLTKNS